MQKIQSANRLQGIEETPYFRTHPVTAERVAFFNEKLRTEKPAAPETALDARLRRIQAKLFAYLEPPEQVIRRYPLSDNSLAAGIAHAVYYMRKRNLPRALEYADKLIKAEPDNPYFWEIKGQALFEGGKPAEAAAAYRRMLELKPESEQFKLAYAEAVITAGAPRSELQKLIPLLEQANRNRAWPSAYRLLGQIYAALGENGTADYFAAEYNYAVGDRVIARRQLAKALKQQLPPNIRLRAEDLNAKFKQALKKKSLF